MLLEAKEGIEKGFSDKLKDENGKVCWFSDGLSWSYDRFRGENNFNPATSICRPSAGPTIFAQKYQRSNLNYMFTKYI